jgi:urease accessory protein
LSAAQLDLSFRQHPERGTYLDRRVFRWPFTLSRGFRLDSVPSGMLTLILQTLSGAIQADDALVQRIRVGAGAAAHVTTQGATMVYRAPAGMCATDTMELEVENGGVLEYLPEPRILFPESSLSQRLLLRAAPFGIAMLSEGFVLHDPTGQGRPFRRYASELVIERPGGSVAVLDRIDLHGMPARGGRRAQYAAHGTLLVVAPLPPPALEALCREIEARVSATPGIYAAASVLPEEVGIGLRVAAIDGRHLRMGLAAGWFAARQHLFGCEPAPRRKDAA